MNYEAARELSHPTVEVEGFEGLTQRPIEEYKGFLFSKFDIELFLEYLEMNKELTDYHVMYDRIHREEEEWFRKDLVVDVRESWNDWLRR